MDIDYYIEFIESVTGVKLSTTTSMLSRLSNPKYTISKWDGDTWSELETDLTEKELKAYFSGLTMGLMLNKRQ